MATAYLGLGSNLGDRLFFIKKAISEAGKLEGTSVRKISTIYETAPWGNTDQGNYLNAVMEIETSLMPEELLKELKSLEQGIGRQEGTKWNAREIDIDILFYDEMVLQKENISIPHPQIENRRFMLVPLNEISPDLVHPVLKKNIGQLLNETMDGLSVIPFTKAQ